MARYRNSIIIIIIIIIINANYFVNILLLEIVALECRPSGCSDAGTRGNGVSVNSFV